MPEAVTALVVMRTMLKAAKKKGVSAQEIVVVVEALVERALEGEEEAELVEEMMGEVVVEMMEGIQGAEPMEAEAAVAEAVAEVAEVAGEVARRRRCPDLARLVCGCRARHSGCYAWLATR